MLDLSRKTQFRRRVVKKSSQLLTRSTRGLKQTRFSSVDVHTAQQRFYHRETFKNAL